MIRIQWITTAFLSTALVVSVISTATFSYAVDGESQSNFEQYVEGLSVRKVYDANASDEVGAEILDLLVGPNRRTEEAILPGAAVLEVTSGAGVIIVKEITRELSMGDIVSLTNEEPFILDNSNNPRQLTVRVILIRDANRPFSIEKRGELNEDSASESFEILENKNNRTIKACEGSESNEIACSPEWPAFRHNGLRTAQQMNSSVLSNPSSVKGLKKRWEFSPEDARTFRASPVVYRDKVFIGNGNGRFYALDAATGAVIWQYPRKDQPALTTQFSSNPSSCGIAASGAIAVLEGNREVVIFGAPDQSIGAGLGSGRLFALDIQTGAEAWKSPEIAVLSGLNRLDTSEFHEQFGYSSPLVLDDKVYIGIANHGDNPIQNGRVAAVDLNTGHLIARFKFSATSTRGGGVWSSPAGGLDGDGIYVTTGNSRCWNGGCQSEPSVNHALSMLHLDRSGNVVWKHQPVPFEMDEDPDWASGQSLMSTSCGPIVASTMKDGWSYAVNAVNTTPRTASVRWQFPPTGFPFRAGEDGDGSVHGDTRYLVPGAAWNDVFVTMTGGIDVVSDVGWGFSRLHALNVCASEANRVRWIADIPNTRANGDDYQLGPPTVTRGIVYVGTGSGHLIALADPSVSPANGSRCSHPGFNLSQCAQNGFKIVPKPSVLANVDLEGGAILTEPVLAKDRVYVSTGFRCNDSGKLFMLSTD